MSFIHWWCVQTPNLEEQPLYKMWRIIVFLGTERPWFLEPIHSQDIQISLRFALWYPASCLVKDFTISWVCASVERVIFQWHLERFVEKGQVQDVAAQGKVPRETRVLYTPSPRSFSQGHAKKLTNPLLIVSEYKCLCLDLSGQTNDEVNMELFTSLGNENKFEKTRHVSPSKLEQTAQILMAIPEQCWQALGGFRCWFRHLSLE